MAFALTALSGLKPVSATSKAEKRGKVIIIEIRDFLFDPAQLEVLPGDGITWINRDIVPHTVTAIDGSWDSGSLKRGEEWSILIDAGMEPEYYCLFHPMMKARLRIGA